MVWFFLGFIIFTYIINKISLKYGFVNLDYKMEVNKRTVEIGDEIVHDLSLPLYLLIKE